MPDDISSDDADSESWAGILAARSAEGRAVVARLRRAEKAALAAQGRVMDAMRQQQECEREYSEFEAAMAEVGRMRREVYRLARQ